MHSNIFFEKNDFNFYSTWEKLTKIKEIINEVLVFCFEKLVFIRTKIII